MPLNEQRISGWLQSIEEKGFVEVNDLIDKLVLARIAKEIERPLNTPMINGKMGYVQYGNARFLNATLSWGRDIIDIYTHPDVIAAMDRYAGQPVHLSNYRIYRTFPSQSARMAWHVDNKIDTYDYAKEQFVTQVVKQDKGLILIMYLSDVQDGGFQLVEGSHCWSTREEKEVWDTEEASFADKIVTFNERPAGTGVLYDYRAIHRAKPYQGGKIRTSLFGQYSPEWMPAGEPILLNTRDLAGLSETQRRVLNFGRKPSTENWPIGRPEEILDALNLSSAAKNGGGIRGMIERPLRRIRAWGR